MALYASEWKWGVQQMEENSLHKERRPKGVILTESIFEVIYKERGVN